MKYLTILPIFALLLLCQSTYAQQPGVARIIKTRSLKDLIELQQKNREQYVFGYTSSNLTTEKFDTSLLAQVQTIVQAAVASDGTRWEHESGVENKDLQQNVQRGFKKNKNTSFPIKFVNIAHRTKGWLPFSKRYDPSLLQMYESAFNTHYSTTYVTQRNSVGAQVAHDIAVKKVVDTFMAAYRKSESEYYKKIRQSTSGNPAVH